jgi:fluoroacetyl-CoA thioesterase
VQPGLSATLRFPVTAEDTARALGSGDVEVLATPRLLAWLEAATCAAVADALDAASTTVGTHVELDHRAPSALGSMVVVTATLTEVAGRRLGFAVSAADEATGEPLGSGVVRRAVVDRARFAGPGGDAGEPAPVR